MDYRMSLNRLLLEDIIIIGINVRAETLSSSFLLLLNLLYVMVNPQLMMSALLRFLVAQWFFVNNSLNWFFGQLFILLIIL